MSVSDEADSAITLVIGNKNYSSWSLRAWLALKMTGEDFTEELIPLGQGNSREQILRHAPSGQVPVLKQGGLVIWDSLAICEYLAETYPDATLWPADPAARAVARAVSAEMHSGFAKLRQNMPMDARESLPGKGMATGVQDDINRITAIWRDCRRRFGGDNGFLFGHFTIADAMFAPVVLRFNTYKPEIGDDALAYCATILSLPEVEAWVAAASKEPWIIEQEVA
ncbi:glutathione S-transferase family protein [Oceanibaculum pacificum]|uniref:Glutathione S-transferase n=1 Tax=Oceanibaculum pacificum TaxID=580166 RepID=A0A154W485_9PROT|nr:glutathione S-transferase family protein [Oceanibaculum pacificum]KZD08267.1 glutathione S-transferase [Oceanibaculum pacificum]